MARGCDQVLAATDAERACLLKVGVDRDRITVVRRGVDARSMRPRDPAERHGPVYRVVLLGTLGRAQVAIRALTADTLSLEAMALGVPVLTGCPELSEGVLDGVTGLHLRGGGPPARELAHSLRRLFDNDSLRDGMGLAARDRALNRYSWARIAAETSRVYQDIYQVSAPAVSGV